MEKNKSSVSTNEASVVALISQQLGKDASKVTADKRIVEDLGADSLDIVEMLMKLEEEYGITIPDDDAMNIKTVGELVSYLDKHQA